METNRTLWPWGLAVLALGLAAYLGLGPKDPGATVANNLPPARKVNDGPMPPPPPPPSRPQPPMRRPNPFAMDPSKPQSSPSKPRAAVWDRSKSGMDKVTFKIMRAEGGKAEVAVFRSPNTLVRRISSPEGKAGVVNVVWDGKDEQGKPVPAGNYFARLSGAGGDNIREINIK